VFVKKPVNCAEGVSYGEAQRVATTTERASLWIPVCVGERESLELLESSWTVQRTTKREGFLYVGGRCSWRGLAIESVDNLACCCYCPSRASRTTTSDERNEWMNGSGVLFTE